MESGPGTGENVREVYEDRRAAGTTSGKRRCLRGEDRKEEKYRATTMAYPRQGVDRSAGTDLDGRGRRDLGSPFHQFQFAEDRPRKERHRGPGRRSLVRIFDRLRQ